jgi:hypothetical protein
MRSTDDLADRSDCSNTGIGDRIQSIARRSLRILLWVALCGPLGGGGGLSYSACRVQSFVNVRSVS